MSIKKKSVTLLQGAFDQKFFDSLKEGEGSFFVLEGRPSLESGKNSCRELLKRKWQPTLIADNMAGFLFYKDLVNEVWMSYQTLDDKQGASCQIGSLILAVLGNKHKVPVKLFPAKRKIKLVGDSQEILYFAGKKVAPRNVRGFVPLVEWVPSKYITKIYKTSLGDNDD